jgi:hypothetical protein
MWKQRFYCKLYLFFLNEPFFRYIITRVSYIKFYNVSSLKQQSAGRHFTPLGHIILLPSQPFIANAP